jgi:hypothetical protein
LLSSLQFSSISDAVEGEPGDPSKSLPRAWSSKTYTWKNSEKKPELHGGPFDPKIAGPVKKKAELGQGTTSWHIPNRPELGSEPSPHVCSHELQADDTNLSDLESHQAVATKKKVSRRSSRRQNPIPHSEAYITGSSEAAEDVEELDLLVSELGILTKRKKALVASAEALGVKPEEVGGRKGDDYRELDSREQRLRARLDELQSNL